MNITLQQAKYEDAAEVAAVLISSRKAFLPYAPSAHSDEDVKKWVLQCLIPSGSVIVARINNEIIGVSAVSRDGGISWIDQLYVAPKFANQGVGSRLLENRLATLKRPIQLYTFQENTSARRFYERFGFQAIEFSDGSTNEEQCPDVLYELSV